MPYLNRRAGGASSSRIILIPDESPFPSVDELNNWSVNNPDKLYNDDSQVTVIVVTDNTGMPDTTGNTYEWSGVNNPDTYDVNRWLIYKGIGSKDVLALLLANPNVNILTDEEKSNVGRLGELLFNEVIITSDSAYQSNVSDSVYAAMSSDTTVILPENPQIRDKFRVRRISNISGNNTLSIVDQHTDGILIVDSSGNAIETETVTLNQSQVLTFEFGTNKWWIYL